MPKFDKRYVHFMWDDKLKGKIVFFADSINYLQEMVKKNHRINYEEVVQGIDNEPFKMAKCNTTWRFCYYDPHYDFKIAYKQGKTIQVYNRLTGEWVDWDYTPDPEWLDGHEYRIKPDESKPVTNRELARWLAQGNGEYYAYDCDGWESYRCIEYQYEQDNLPVSKVMVRKWEDEEWHHPTREYMGLED